MKVVFMGTPDFAVPSLRRLVADGHQVCGVFTQPDKPKNRGMKLIPTPVKVEALSHGIPVYQPASVKDGAALEELKRLAPELIVVAAYGKILPKEILELPPKGCINVHSSLLPKYRGAAPINWAVIHGETETGVTIMHMAQALDAGDIIDTVSTPIDPEETVETLHDRLAELGAELLCRVVKEINAGTAKRIPQKEEEATYAPMLSRALLPIDWSRSAKDIHNQVRGLIPWPATTVEIHGVKLKVYTVQETGQSTDARPGAVLGQDKQGLLMACGDGKILRIVELQAEGGKRMKAVDYLRGHPLC